MRRDGERERAREKGPLTSEGALTGDLVFPRITFGRRLYAPGRGWGTRKGERGTEREERDREREKKREERREKRKEFGRAHRGLQRERVEGPAHATVGC